MASRERTLSRRLSVAAAVLLLGTSLAACGILGGGQPASSGKTISVPNDKAGWAPWFNQIGQDVAKADGGSGFKSQPYSSTTAYQAVMDNLVTSSQAPAVYTWWSGSQMKLLAKEHAIANLTPQVQHWMTAYGLSPRVMDAYKVNGSYYGVPMYEAYWPVFYNTAVFKRYGLQPPTTWAQLVNVANTLKAHGVTPFGQLVGGWTGFVWFENILINMDPGLYNRLMAGKASYTDPGVVSAMKFWSSLQKDGWFKQYPGTTPVSGMEKGLANGQVGMMLMGSWDEPTIVQNGLKPGSGFGAFIMPPITKGLGYQLIFETGPFVVSNNSPQKSQAMKEMNTFMQPAIQKKWTQITDFESPESSVPDSNTVNAGLAKAVRTDNVNLLNRFFEATPPQIETPAADQLSKEILNPSQYMSILSYIQNQIAAPYWKAHPQG
jgi:multiple sugar transport system substrate-binding protein